MCEQAVNISAWELQRTYRLKQKRKVYRDGFLSLHTSTGEVMLYDDGDQLLEGRILKNDEVVSSGETLTFNAYLVDVGEPEEGQKPLDDTYTRSPEKNAAKQKTSLHRNEFGKVPDCTGDKKTKVEKDKQQTISLSPSQKIIREFKKNEMNKYGILQPSSNSRTSSTTDWHALYTTHLTQKSEKYHDGFLCCTSSGFMTRQVFLYDMGWKLLDSRFLNKVKEVSPGGTMEFPGHLVEIGCRAANHESLRDPKACGNSSNSLRKLNMQKQQHNVAIVKSAVKEEKDGRMHQNGAKGSLLDAGISSVIVSLHFVLAEHVRLEDPNFPVTLYDASRKVLVNKFLRKDEVLGTGKSLVFDSHLVDIGEHVVEEKASMGLNDGEPCRAAGEMRKGHEEVNCVKVDQSIPGVRQQKHGDNTPGKVHPAKDLNSDFGKSHMKSTDCIRRIPEAKPLRNGDVSIDHEDYLLPFDVTLPCVIRFRHNANEVVLFRLQMISYNPINAAYQILSILQKLLDQVAIAENSYEREATFASLTKEIQHSDDSSHCAQRQRAPAAKLASVENVDTRNLIDSAGNENLPGLMKSKELASYFKEFHSTVGFEIGNSQPSHEPADPKCCSNNLASEASLSFGSHGDADDKKTTPEGDRDPLKVKAECPSFDLGF